MAPPLLRRSDLTRYRRALLARFDVRTQTQCRRFVDVLGFCYAFTGGPGEIPGLFDVIGTRSEDRMWSWAWRWKDDLATRRRLYYGRILRRKPTFVSLTYLPYFYALSGNVGEPDDYLAAYRAGALSALARELFEEIAARGPVNTWARRRRFVGRRGSGSRMHRALDELQARFLITKVAEEEGRGNYAFIWDTFARWMPEVIPRAAGITTEDAAGAVLRGYLHIVGAATERQIEELFRWPTAWFPAAAQRAGAIDVTLDGPGVERGRYWSLPDVLTASRQRRASVYLTQSRTSAPAR